MVQMSNIPYGSRMNTKSMREKERRDEINNKINELRALVCEDELERRSLKQADVLSRTVDLVYRLESESPGPSCQPERRGFLDGFQFVETEVSAFIRQLGMDHQITLDFIARVRQCFDMERGVLTSTPKRNGAGGAIRRSPTNSQRSTPSPYAKLDRKEIKKNREQDRRDRQGEAIEALKNFLISISASSLTSRVQIEKMQRLNTLENIIEYINNKKNRTNLAINDGPLYQHAFNGGFEIAKRLGMEFFRRDKHLNVRTAALEQHLDMKRAMKMNPLYSYLMAANAQSISPAHSLESPPPASDTSVSSVESSTHVNIWRPWE